MSRRPRVALLATGGTIACTLDRHGHAVKSISAAGLLASVPALPEIEASGYDYGLLASWDVAPPVMLDIARRVDELLAAHDGVVVTHGTDTLEETATMLSFAVRSNAPVVVTGAMRANGEPGADGSRNLSAALRVAAHPDAAGRGALVVLGDEVHRAVTVSKRHSSSPSAFGSPATGPIGLIHGERVTFIGYPVPPTRYDVRHADADVPLIFAAAGAPTRIVESALAGAAGLVVAGFGLGHVPATWMPLLGAASRNGVPVIMASRTPAGPVGGRYAGAGGDVDASERGLILAGHRTPYSARIQLICAIGAGADPVEAFAQPIP